MTTGQRGKSAAAALALVAALCACYAVGVSAQRRPPARGVNSGAVYQQHCARCHGEDGNADTDQGRLYDATDFTDAGWWDKERPSDARLRRVIARGKTGGMPAYAKKLSAAEIDALVPYVRGFKR